MSETTSQIHIDGMSCQGCVASITRALTALPGVTKVSVSLENRLAAIHYDNAQLLPAAFVQAIEDAGFDARLPMHPDTPTS